MTAPEVDLLRADEPYGDDWDCQEEEDDGYIWLPEDHPQRVFIGFGDRIIPNEWDWGKGDMLLVEYNYRG